MEVTVERCSSCWIIVLPRLESVCSKSRCFSEIDLASETLNAKMMCRWMCHPLRSVDAINARLDAVDSLCDMPGVLESLQSQFRKLPDLERFISRIHAGSCRIKDFVLTLAAYDDIQVPFHRFISRPQRYHHEIFILNMHSVFLKSLALTWKNQVALLCWKSWYKEGFHQTYAKSLHFLKKHLTIVLQSRKVNPLITFSAHFNKDADIMYSRLYSSTAWSRCCVWQRRRTHSEDW